VRNSGHGGWRLAALALLPSAPGLRPQAVTAGTALFYVLLLLLAAVEGLLLAETVTGEADTVVLGLGLLALGQAAMALINYSVGVQAAGYRPALPVTGRDTTAPKTSSDSRIAFTGHPTGWRRPLRSSRMSPHSSPAALTSKST